VPQQNFTEKAFSLREGSEMSKLVRHLILRRGFMAMNSTIISGISGTLAILTAFSFLTDSNPANAETKLILNSFVPARSAPARGFVFPFQKKLAKVSGGEISVTIPPASLAPAKRQWEMVSKGVADIGFTNTSFIRNRLKLPQISRIPFTTLSAESATIALMKTHKKYFAAANEYKGMKFIGVWAYPAYQFHSAKEAIQKVSDLKGMKLHVVPGPTKKIAEILGATIVTGPTVKIFELISGKTVDGALIPNNALVPFKYARYINSITNVPGGLGSNSMAAFMNKKIWDGLSKKHKNFVDQTANDSFIANVGTVLDKTLIRAGKDITKHKIKVLTASDEFTGQMKKMLQPLKDSWMKAAKSRGVDGQAAFDYYVKTGQEAVAKMK
jgi:TRAP-type transport system periplasmic protein